MVMISEAPSSAHSTGRKVSERNSKQKFTQSYFPRTPPYSFFAGAASASPIPGSRTMAL